MRSTLSNNEKLDSYRNGQRSDLNQISSAQQKIVAMMQQQVSLSIFSSMGSCRGPVGRAVTYDTREYAIP